MGRKDVLSAWPMFSPSPTDISVSQLSQQTTIQYMDNVAIIATWTGTSPVGILSVEVSNDNFTTATALNFGTTLAVSGNTGSANITMNQLPYGSIRLRYTSTSGTGTLTAVMSSKQVGG